jgi:UDP-N-acetylmuramate--alanine ligase
MSRFVGVLISGRSGDAPIFPIPRMMFLEISFSARRTHGGFMKLPRDIGPIHFVGIGGIGMSGIAEVLANLGYTVKGSDVADSANVKRLRDQGIAVAIGHAAANIAGADVVVVSSAIRRDNPELLAARAKRLPVVRRAEMLAELMRLKSCIAIAGTHGKTTTTSLVAALLDAGRLDPTVINGGIINAYGTNARLGAGDWMVVEADESDGTFLKLPADIAIVTNVDPEHLDHFQTFAAVQAAFQAFVENVPFYGFAVMCTDHPVVQTLVGRIEDRRIVTYGENPQADVRLIGLHHADGAARFAVVFRDRAGGTAHALDNLVLPMPGRHNALNATAAIAVAHDLGIEDGSIRQALAGFGGVRRRFTRTGTWNGVAVIDDYGHHPVEIAAVLRAARESTKGQVIAVVQPHRYTRLNSLFEGFCTCCNDADSVIVAHVYPAGEAPIPGADRDSLVAGMRARGHRHVLALDRPQQLAGLVRNIARPGDYVVCLGAGSITQWAYALPGELAALGAAA